MIDKVKRNYLVLGLILICGLIFRLYHFDKLFLFAHDQDLYSWIAKDIVMNRHIRSVGQVTSVDGVFIGPAYYYLIAFFYWISGMNPMSAAIPITIIGLATIFSFYLIGKRFFSVRVGLILSASYSLSWGAALFDRWSVPTEPTILWSVWFLYIIFGALKGNVKLLPVYALLLGFVYHIHIALLPILPLPILAYFMSDGNIKSKFKKISLKNIFLSLGILLIISSPFWIFEIKHNFSQVRAVISAMNLPNIGPTGIRKIEKVIDASGREWQQRWLFGLDWVSPVVFWLLNIIISLIVIINKKLNGKHVVLLGLWIGLIVLAQFTSKKVVSEYYFTNLCPILFLLFALFLDYFIKNKIILVVSILFFGTVNLFWMLKNGYNTESYYERARLVDYIKSDAKAKNFPCVGINYITDFGKGVGFRYLFWYKRMNIIKPSGKVPVYNIVIPLQISEKELNKSFGRFGVILPKNNTVPNEIICQSKESQLDPLL